MSTFLRFICLSFAAVLLGSFLTTSASAAEMEIVPIQDMQSYINIKLFNGPLSKTERKKFFPGGEALGAINVFVIKNNENTILVDTGYGSNTSAKGAAQVKLESLGIKREDVNIILLTHMHSDHAMGLLKGKKAVYPKAKVLVSKDEADFWLSDAALKGQHSANAQIARDIKTAYGDRLKTFAFDEEVLPGITALNGAGHTPGHTLFMVKSGDDRLLIVGDLIHAYLLQFAYPDECPSYDMDKEKAIAKRKEVLNMAASEGLLIAGMHIPGGGIGKVKSNGKGGFVFLPASKKD